MPLNTVSWQKIHSFKGRVVFRRDNVRGESGHLAVFSEQGTSASHLVAAKFLDAIARMPENDGQDSDATRGVHPDGTCWGTDLGLSTKRQMAPKLARKVLTTRRTTTFKLIRTPIIRLVLGTALQQSHPVMRLPTSRRMGMPVQTHKGKSIPLSVRR